MAHASPAAGSPASPRPGVEAAARLASIRQALRTADMMAGKPSADLSAPVEISEAWADLPASTRRCFEARTERVANAAHDGLESMKSGPLHPLAAERLAEELRAALPHIESLLVPRDATSTSLSGSSA